MAEMRDEKRTTTSSPRRTDTAQPTSSQQETTLRPSGGLGTRGQSGGLTRYRDPFSLFGEMDRLFQNLGFGGGLMPAFGRDIERNLWSPQIELYEKDGKLHVRADLPGLSKDDVHCEVRDNVLILEGERKQEQKDERGGWSERFYGNFYRAIPLPEGVNPDTAKASFDNGVLEILLDAPKKEGLGAKQIPIT
jgi:HSP20 family protein